MSWTIDENYKIEMTKGDTPTFVFDIFLPMSMKRGTVLLLQQKQINMIQNRHLR